MLAVSFWQELEAAFILHWEGLPKVRGIRLWLFLAWHLGRILNPSCSRDSHRFPGASTSCFSMDSFCLHPCRMEHNMMLQVFLPHLCSMEREGSFKHTEGFASAIQKPQSRWSKSVLEIVSTSPLPTEGTVSSLRFWLRLGKLLLTGHLCNVYTWERQFFTLTGLYQFAAIEKQWPYLLGNTSGLLSAL